MPKTVTPSVLQQPIEYHIQIVRGRRVMVDSDLAKLYGVQTRRLNEAVKRNASRFPEAFMFRLTAKESASMRSQIATASKRNIRHQPLAFTEHGVVMLSAVLNSKRAVQMSIVVVNAFVRMRELVAADKLFGTRIRKLELDHGTDCFRNRNPCRRHRASH
jgi:phage regulator Rha-like protein